MWQLRKITDFPSPPSTLVSHGYPHRLQPPLPAPAPSPVNPLRSLNTLTCTYTTCEHTRAQKKKKRTQIYAGGYSCERALTHTQESSPSLPPSQSSSYLAAKSSHGNALVNLPLCSLVLINWFKWKCAVKWHRALVLVSEIAPSLLQKLSSYLVKTSSHLTLPNFFFFINLFPTCCPLSSITTTDLFDYSYQPRQASSHSKLASHPRPPCPHGSLAPPLISQHGHYHGQLHREGLR